MMDVRLKQLGDNILNYSCQVKSGDKVLIESTKNSGELIKYLIREIYKRGALPFVILKESDIRREIILNGTEEQFKIMAEEQKTLMKEMDVYIEITEYDNCYEMNDVPIEKRRLFQKHFYQPVYRENGIRRWTTVGFPTKSMAQRFEMSTESFENFYFSVVNANYQELSEKMEVLKSYLEKTDKVHLIGNDLDLSFSIKNMPVYICDGRINIPDGEVFVAPHLYSANGKIKFNVDTLYQGYKFSDLELVFENGKVIEEKSSKNQQVLTKILDTDEGSRFIGEFAIGTNPNITRPVGNIIYDEKMLGSFHIALGHTHPESDNKNRSAIHWDIVYRMEPEHGNAKMYFDDELIVDGGIFIPKKLQLLNKKQ